MKRRLKNEGRERGRSKRMLSNSQHRTRRFVDALADPKSLREAELWEVRFEQFVSELHHCLKLARELGLLIIKAEGGRQ